MAIQTEMVQVNGPHGTFDAYLAVPESGSGPGVVVIQEIFGVNSHIREVTERVAPAGYSAISPDLFWQVEPGFTWGYEAADIEKARGYMGQVSPDKAVDDVGATMDLLRGRPECSDDGLGVVGFCWGGRITYLTAARLEPVCASAYYGGGIANHLDEADNINAPIMLHFGALDAAIPMDQVDAVKGAVAGKPGAEVFVYPEAQHGFHCDQRGSYHQPSAQQAWARTMELFSANLG